MVTMDRQTKKRRPGLIQRSADRIEQAVEWCEATVKAGWKATMRWLRPWKPVVLVDAKRGRARRLRRMIVRATQAQYRALGVAPPPHLLVVVQRHVRDERPLASLLQVFEDTEHRKRHVLFLALMVGEESVSDGAVVATLRQQLHEVVAEALGPIVCTVPTPAAQPRSAAVVPLHPPRPAPPIEDEAPPLDDTYAPVDDGYAVAVGS